MWGGALISTVLGTELPGPGTIYVSQSLQFRRPIALGDTVTVKVKVVRKDDAKHHVAFDCMVTNQNGHTVISGTADVVAPTEKICRERIMPPIVEIHDIANKP
jgi:acyl dehydratase